MSDPSPDGSDAGRGATPLDAGKATLPWYQMRPVIGGGVIALGLVIVWGFRMLSPPHPDVQKAEPPPPPAKTKIAVAADPTPVAPPRVAAKPLQAADPKPPEDDTGLRSPVMAIKTQGQPKSAQTPAGAVGGRLTAPNGTVGASMIATDVVQVQAVKSGNGTFRLSAGTVIPCILDTAMDTTLAGFIRCHLDKDIYSDTGAVVVLDAGTVVMGEYQASLKQGQERIGVVWSRARTPKGITIKLDSPGTDPVGRAGMDGEVETFFWTRYGAAVMFSLLQDAGAFARAYATYLATNGGSNSNGAVNPSVIGINTQSASEQTVGSTLRNSANIAPVLKKNQGERVDIFVRNDLEFSQVYALQK
ncbi:MAG: TrbI/VirB10 family protein [Proteobacteria bacterium]|nr:TrbI/VirB10 family protein [Pseudomonadota bacterium]